MTENKEVMARNIRYYMSLNKVNSTEMCKTLGFKQSTFSNWINAKIYPRIDKIEMMANYFGITKADLVEERPRSFDSPAEFEKAWQAAGGAPHGEGGYYLDPESAALAEFAHKNPEYKVLFDASRKVKPEDINFVLEMIKRTANYED